MEKTQENNIAIRHSQHGANQYTPQIFDRIADPIEAVTAMGNWFAKSGMFGCEKTEQGMILALAALCERKSPLEIADTYHLVGGQLTMKSRAQLAKFRQHGGRVKWLESTDTNCKAEWTFEGETTTVSFSRKEAESMGLIRPKSGWDKAPAEMLRARNTTRAITMLCPEILVGGGVEDAQPMHENVIEMLPQIETAELPKDPTPPKRIVKKEEPKKELVQLDEDQQKEKAAEAIEEGVEKMASGEQIDAILTLCAENECDNAADAWLVGKGWIKESGKLNTLTDDNAKRILNAPQKFIRAVKQAESKK